MAAVLVGVLPAAPAAALDVEASDKSRVLGEVTRERLEIHLGSGAVARGDVLRFREDDPAIELKSHLARGTTSGTEKMVPFSTGLLRQGAFAGVNGGYFQSRPWGQPNGLHVADGRLVAGQAVNSLNGGGWPTGRGMVGIQPSGRMVMDELLVNLELDLLDGVFEIDEINRQVWPESATRSNGDPWRPNGELLLFDERFGSRVELPGGSTVAIVRGMEVGTSGRTEGEVIAVYHPPDDTTLPVSADRHVLVAYGARADDLVGIEGQRIGVTTTITPKRTAAEGWQDLTSGVAGGQLMVQDGVRRPGEEWTSYAAFGDSHALVRQPRTAIGRTADGQNLLVTIDGRQLGWSVGVTVRELADTMIALGAVDAVNLDGGGSTTMTINASITNRPSEVGRSVADGLFLHAALPPANRALVNACPDGQVPASAFDDAPGTTHAAAIDCLAWWAVTQGVTETRYAPDAGVTREQMASFVARWIDGVSDRGDGKALPAAGAMRFQDVASSNVHADAIARLTDVGIIRGTSETTYAPRRVMTRAQTASLLHRAVEYVTETPLSAGRDTFVDDNGSVHEATIDAFAGVGVITGTGGFEFRPQGPVTRGAMAALVMRSSDLVVELERTVPPS